jgi:hypothetical protein
MNTDILITSYLIVSSFVFLGLFLYFTFFNKKDNKNIEEESILNSLLEKSIENKSFSETQLTELLNKYNSIEKDLHFFSKSIKNIEDNSLKSSNEISSLFNNGKSVGIIGEDFLYSTLIKLDCFDLSSHFSLTSDQDILLFMKDRNIKFAFKKQYLLSNGSIPDCVVFCTIKINEEESILKKIIIDSKAIINAFNVNDKDLVNKLSAQMKNLSKKEYFKGLDNSFNNVILFFPFIGILDSLKDNNYSAYKEMLNDFREQRIIFSTAENILLTLEIILDGYNTHQLQETSKIKEDILEKSKEIESIKKQFKNGLKERINSSDLLTYLSGTIKREIAIYKYISQFEDDVDKNKEIQEFLKDLDKF